MRGNIKAIIYSSLGIVVIILISKTLWNYNTPNVCLPINSHNSALYLESYLDQDKCIYNLNDFFGFESKNFFFLNSKKGYIGTKSEQCCPEILFYYDEPIGTKRRIKINSGDWLNGEGHIMKMRIVEVSKINQQICSKEEIVHIRIESNKYYFEEVGLLDINVIFSNRLGFTGTFLTDKNEPNVILSVDGYIYEDCLGLDKFERRFIK